MNLKEMDAEIARLTASAAASAASLKAKDDQIANLTAEIAVLKLSATEATTKETASADEITTLKAQNAALTAETVKLKAAVEAAEGSAARKALDIIAKSGHPAPLEGNTPKDDGEKKLSSKLTGRARLAAIFNKQFAPA